MDIKSKIEELLIPLLEDDKFFVVDVKVSLSKLRSKVLILLDSDEGILIDDCSKISRALGTELDEILPDAYTLEVSSPGVDTPLSSVRHYRKNIGRNVLVKLLDGTEKTGKLLDVSETGISVEETKKKSKTNKVETIEIHQIEYQLIKETKVTISFK